MYIVQVYSNESEGEKMTFKYYDSSDDEIIEYNETIEFVDNMNVGDGFNTFALSREMGDILEPSAYSISEAYPNPFNPVTSFNYTLADDGLVHVAVYDVNGRQVAELVNGFKLAGSYPVMWDANDLSSGIYIVKMLANEYTAVQ